MEKSVQTSNYSKKLHKLRFLSRKIEYTNLLNKGKNADIERSLVIRVTLMEFPRPRVGRRFTESSCLIYQRKVNVINYITNDCTMELQKNFLFVKDICISFANIDL
ncbi:unnamed protein product [Rhizophagus irregularis]|nr:unnamed protein product [Rhizophagus irregularis]CAB5185393.1 unnamed protein product [Rhizophagus irregularis]CAB5371329.1 unnamed protein product [Rhizophagus irregularis]